MSFHVPNQHRIKSGPFGSDNSIGNAGAFFVPLLKFRKTFKVIASDSAGWEHVSVSLPERCPTWEEMCALKAIFWDDDDCVVQFHPPKSEYVNNHPYCLHLWRSTQFEFPLPDSLLVGVKGATYQQISAMNGEEAVEVMQILGELAERKFREQTP